MKTSVAALYGSLTFFTTIIHNTFLLYHIDYYLSIVKINMMAFWCIEIIFLVWNSVNDPIFGWISDKSLLVDNGSENSKINSRVVVMRRVHALSWAYPLFAVSFLTFWLPLPSYLAAFQLLSALCLYDTFLTTIELHHTGLLVDLTTSTRERADLNFYNALFGCIGASTVFISYTIWDPTNPVNFRWYCLVISLVSMFGFMAIVHQLKKSLSIVEDDKKILLSQSTRNDARISPFAFMKQLSKNPNFVWFSAMDLIQVLHCHFNSCFFPLILDSLLKTDIKARLGSVLLALSFIAPHFNNLYLTHLCKHYGTYRVVRVLFYLKLLFPVMLLSCGMECTSLLLIFVACNRIFTEGLCKVLNLVLSELIDEDCVLSRRPHPVAALISGTVSLVTKPGQTLAPIIGTALISYLSTSNSNEKSVNINVDAHSTRTAMSQTAIFYTIIWVPIACAFLQILMWTQYRLRDSRLKLVQHFRNSRLDTAVSSSLTYLPL